MLRWSILGSLVLDIDLCNLIFRQDTYDIAGYQENTTPYITGKILESLSQNQKKFEMQLANGFTDNQMQANTSKCYVLMCTAQKNM